MDLLKKDAGLTKERMKMIKGGGAGLCYFYCLGTNTVYTVPYASCNGDKTPCHPGEYTCQCDKY